MRLNEVMSTKVASVSPGTPADEALSLMRRNRIRHLVVTDGRDVRGVLSERDLRGTAGRDDTAGDLMAEQLVAATPTTSVRQAANLMRGRGVGCLPVLDGRRLVGIVTTSDLLELIGRGVERPVARTQRWTLRDRGPRAQSQPSAARREASTTRTTVAVARGKRR